jgi:DNA primase large subunit
LKKTFQNFYLTFLDSEELRNWFLTQECALFRYRFEGEPQKDKEEFIDQHNLGYELVKRALSLHIKTY